MIKEHRQMTRYEGRAERDEGRAERDEGRSRESGEESNKI
jgi:hypothetical protein